MGLIRGRIYEALAAIAGKGDEQIVEVYDGRVQVGGTPADPLPVTVVDSVPAVDLAATANVVAITAASVVITIPTAGRYHLVTAVGDAAYIKAGTSGSAPVATTAVGGFGMCIAEGAVYRMFIPASSPDIAVIGFGASIGFIQFVPEIG